jgi:hypothetical protein
MLDKDFYLKGSNHPNQPSCLLKLYLAFIVNFNFRFFQMGCGSELDIQ